MCGPLVRFAVNITYVLPGVFIGNNYNWSLNSNKEFDIGLRLKKNLTSVKLIIPTYRYIKQTNIEGRVIYVNIRVYVNKISSGKCTWNIVYGIRRNITLHSTAASLKNTNTQQNSSRDGTQQLTHTLIPVVKPQSVSWFDAKKHCQSRGETLATLTEWTDIYILQEIMKNIDAGANFSGPLTAYVGLVWSRVSLN